MRRAPQDIHDQLNERAKRNGHHGAEPEEAMGNGHHPELEDAATVGGHQEKEYAYHLTDLGNAQRLVTRHGEDLRFCHPWNKWLVWDGSRWRVDDNAEVRRRAIDTVSAIYEEAGSAGSPDERKSIAKHAQQSEGKSRIDGMLSLASALAGIPVLPGELDSDHWLLNVANGTLDLRRGELREHQREDLITKVAPVEYDPEAEANRFTALLGEVFGGDEDLISFVKRFAGYSLTGSVEERTFAILHGRGKNGKSTLIETLQEAMGDYADTTDTETILSKRHSGIGNDVAALKGARFISAAEVDQDRRLAESKVKQLTGNDTVSARFLYGEPFKFKPEFTLWLSTNNKPVIRGTDDAIWDRIRLVPFEQRFTGERCDPALPRKLREELPGVLAWMVEGCLEWQRDGLGEPDRVMQATEGYRAEQDALAAFFEDRCVIHPGASAGATQLYDAYKDWCAVSGEYQMKQTAFGRELGDRGFIREKTQRVVWHGIGLRGDRPDPDGPVDGLGPDTSHQNGPEDAKSGPNRLSVDSSAPNCLNAESRIDTPNAANQEEPLDSCRPFFQQTPSKSPREESFPENRLNRLNRLKEQPSTATLGTGDNQRPLSADEGNAEVQRLIESGMREDFAVEEVMKRMKRHQDAHSQPAGPS